MTPEQQNALATLNSAVIALDAAIVAAIASGLDIRRVREFTDNALLGAQSGRRSS